MPVLNAEKGFSRITWSGKAGLIGHFVKAAGGRNRKKKLKAKSAALMSSVNLNLVEVIYFNKI